MKFWFNKKWWLSITEYNIESHAFDVADAALCPADGMTAEAGALFSLNDVDKLLLASGTSLAFDWDCGTLDMSDVLALALDADTATVNRESRTLSTSLICASTGWFVSSGVSQASSAPSHNCLDVRDSSAAIRIWTATVLACSHTSATWKGDSALSRRNVSSEFALQSKQKVNKIKYV